MLVTKADRETVPEIDQAYQCGEVDQLLILEVPADFGVGRIGLQYASKLRSTPSQPARARCRGMIRASFG
jgi:hypothetical protein